jgi:hypothetical protein
MTNCCGKTTKGEPCKRKAVDGLEIDGEMMCKQHYANSMLLVKMNEIGALKVPEEVVSEPSVKCVGTTKKGEPCKNDGLKDHEGLCKSHYKIVVKNREKKAESENDPKPTEPIVPKVKCKGMTVDGKECKNYEAEKCDGHCKRHFDKLNKVEKEKTEKKSPIMSDKSVDELLAEAKRLAMPKMPAASDNLFANVEIPNIEFP